MKLLDEFIDNFLLFLLDLGSEIPIEVCIHDVHELVENFSNALLVQVLQQAVEYVRVWSKYVGDDLLLLPIDQENEQLAEISGKDRVQRGLFRSDELEEAIEKHVLADRFLLLLIFCLGQLSSCSRFVFSEGRSLLPFLIFFLLWFVVFYDGILTSCLGFLLGFATLSLLLRFFFIFFFSLGCGRLSLFLLFFCRALLLTFPFGSGGFFWAVWSRLRFLRSGSGWLGRLSVSFVRDRLLLRLRGWLFG